MDLSIRPQPHHGRLVSTGDTGDQDRRNGNRAAATLILQTLALPWFTVKGVPLSYLSKKPVKVLASRGRRRGCLASLHKITKSLADRPDGRARCFIIFNTAYTMCCHIPVRQGSGGYHSHRTQKRVMVVVGAGGERACRAVSRFLLLSP